MSWDFLTGASLPPWHLLELFGPTVVRRPARRLLAWPGRRVARASPSSSASCRCWRPAPRQAVGAGPAGVPPPSRSALPSAGTSPGTPGCSGSRATPASAFKQAPRPWPRWRSRSRPAPACCVSMGGTLAAGALLVAAGLAAVGLLTAGTLVIGKRGGGGGGNGLAKCWLSPAILPLVAATKIMHTAAGADAPCAARGARGARAGTWYSSRFASGSMTRWRWWPVPGLPSRVLAGRHPRRQTRSWRTMGRSSGSASRVASSRCSAGATWSCSRGR